MQFSNRDHHIFFSTTGVKVQTVAELHLSSLNWDTLHASVQSNDKISELISTPRSSLHSVRLHHFPIIRSPLCPHFLSHSWPAKSPMTLCCCAAVLFWENLGQLGCDAVSWVSVAVVRCEKRARARIHGFRRRPALSACEADRPPWPKCEFWCKLEEVQHCQRGWVSSERTEHIPEGSRGCDFSRLSQGLGYSVCLCELMLLLSQCLSNPVEQWYTICSRCEETQGSIIVLLDSF